MPEVGCWEDEEVKYRDIRAVKILFDTIMMDMCHHTIFSKLVEYITPTVNSRINHELWVIMMCYVVSPIVTNAQFS